MRLSSVLERRAIDVLVVALALAGEIEIAIQGGSWTAAAAVLLGTLPLLLRRRFPFAAPAFAFAAVGGMALADPSAVAEGSSLVLIVFLLAFWLAGADNEGQRASAAVAMGFASLAAIAQSAGNDYRVETGDVGLDLVTYLYLGGALSLAAYGLQRRARRAAALEEEAARLERDRDERARAAVAAERERIARDLHEVIAHSLSVMTVQAGAARVLLPDKAPRAREPLLAVEDAGRQALTEMRRLLGILRSDDGEAVLAPQPGLADLTRLVEQARLAGIVVALVVEGEAGALPPGVDVAAYRLVQEALTNAHADAGLTRARVVVRHEPRTLELEIDSDGVVAANGVPDTDALLGVLRERVSVYGGALEARPSAAGGHTISARFPLPALASTGGRAER